MSEKDDTKISSLISSYSGFISASLNRIFNLYLDGTPFQRYYSVRDLYLFLPTAVKDKVKALFDASDKRIQEIKKQDTWPKCSYDQHVLMVKALQGEFDRSSRMNLDATMRELDKRGYMEQTWHRVDHKDFQEFGDRGENQQ